jgi:3-deoxy-D-manno-octulosonic acid (KDO) 8-phosphate synthase
MNDHIPLIWYPRSIFINPGPQPKKDNMDQPYDLCTDMMNILIRMEEIDDVVESANERIR